MRIPKHARRDLDARQALGHLSRVAPRRVLEIGSARRTLSVYDAHSRPGGKAVRDTINGVKVDFLITGDYPGDGKPKPVRFPEPAAVSIEAGPFRILPLARLLELKLASGMSAPHRLQDLADVQRLVAVLRRPRETSESLDPYVRERFDELWASAQHEDEDD